MRWVQILAMMLVLTSACGRESTEDADTTALEPGGATGGGAGDDAATTTTGGGATTAATVEATGAPSPPQGYAVESRPATDGALATIEYLSPQTAAEVAEFYDGQIQTDRRVQLDVAGDDVVVYGMGASSTIGPATRIQDVERLLDERSEPMVVVGPFQMQAEDPLIGDLRSAGQQTQADALIETKSKITVVYVIQ